MQQMFTQQAVSIMTLSRGIPKNYVGVSWKMKTEG